MRYLRLLISETDSKEINIAFRKLITSNSISNYFFHIDFHLAYAVSLSLASSKDSDCDLLAFLVCSSCIDEAKKQESHNDNIDSYLTTIHKPKICESNFSDLYDKSFYKGYFICKDSNTFRYIPLCFDALIAYICNTCLNKDLHHRTESNNWQNTKEINEEYREAKNPILIHQDLSKETKEPTIVFEVIAKGNISEDIQRILSCYCNRYNIYERLRVNLANLKNPFKTISSNQSNCNIDLAKRSDSKDIYHLLLSTFDIYLDNLPSYQKLLSYIDSNQVLISKSNNKIDSLVIWTLQGRVSHFNYLINISSNPFAMPSILRAYYEILKSKNIMQAYLWVDINRNARLRSFHIQRYGYKPDGTFNHIFIFNPRSNE